MLMKSLKKILFLKIIQKNAFCSYLLLYFLNKTILLLYYIYTSYKLYKFVLFFRTWFEILSNNRLFLLLHLKRSNFLIHNQTTLVQNCFTRNAVEKNFQKFCWNSKPPSDFLANGSRLDLGIDLSQNYMKINGRWQPIVLLLLSFCSYSERSQNLFL